MKRVGALYVFLFRKINLKNGNESERGKKGKQ